jgi:hypothetical protein
MDSKDMLPSTMVHRSWKLLLKKLEKMEKYHNHLLKMIVVAMEPKILQEPICNATKIQVLLVL